MSKFQQNEFLIKVLSHHKLTKSQLMTYEFLFDRWQHESIPSGKIYCASQKEIGTQIGLKQATVSRAIDELAEMQLITRYPIRVNAVEIYLVTPPEIALTLLKLGKRHD